MKLFENLMVFIGMATTITLISVLFRYVIAKLPELFHKHKYQVHSVWRVSDCEEQCERWSVTLSCECGKEKEIEFYNKGIKLEVANKDDGNDNYG